MGDNSNLKKDLGAIDIFSISSGAMISSGLFVLPALAFSMAGSSVILSYLLASLLIMPAMFAKIELATAMPKSGGTYFFVGRSMGPMVGTFAGLANFMSIALKSAFAIVGIGLFLGPMISPNPWVGKGIALIFTALFTLINLGSTKHSGRFQSFMVFGLIGIILFYIIGGAPHVVQDRLSGVFQGDMGQVFAVAGMVFISFGGLTKIASVAEEIKNPSRNIPLGMISSFIIVTILYLLVVTVSVGILDPAILATANEPLTEGARIFGGNTAAYLLRMAALFAFFTTANAGLLSASRSPLAMAQDNLLPKVFTKVDTKHGIPRVSVVFTGLLMALLIVSLDLEKLVKVASAMQLLLFVFENISTMVMRMSKISTYKPTFKAPLFPWLNIISSVIYLFLIWEMGTFTVVASLVFVALTLIWYALYSGFREKQDSALMHLVQRITSKELRDDTLSDELKQILRTRDNIVTDRFDHIIEDAPILEIPEGSSMEDLFGYISDEFAKIIPLDQDMIKQLLLKRESESTTVISTGLAVPHIITETSGDFSIIIARSGEGIIFPDNPNPVHVIFALAGAKDERNFHLQALMAIAQILQNPDFTEAWNRAKDTKELRNLILLAERTRTAEV